MTRVYFAGVNQTAFATAFEGEHVLETFADRRRVLDRFRPTFAGVAMDSGAFTEASTGKAIDLVEYTDFVVEHGAAYDFVAALDSIQGGADQNVKNLHYMLDRGALVVPTWHSGEPLTLFDQYCAAGYVGVGMVRPEGKFPPRDVVCRYLDAVFSRVPEGVRLHGWGLTSFLDYPFFSVDSTTWLWEYKALLSVKGQGASVLGCLTPPELLQLVKKKYQRIGHRARFGDAPQE